MIEVQGYDFFYTGDAKERKILISMAKLGIPLHGVASRFIKHSIDRPNLFNLNMWSYSDLDARKFTETGRLRKEYHDYYWKVKP